MSQTCSYMLYIHVLVHYKISGTSNELGKGGFENFVDTTTLSFHIDPFINYDTGHFNVPQKSQFSPCGAKDAGFRRLALIGSLPKRSGEKKLKIDHTIVKNPQIGRREKKISPDQFGGFLRLCRQFSFFFTGPFGTVSLCCETPKSSAFCPTGQKLDFLVTFKCPVV